jgi:hypothetical protein
MRFPGLVERRADRRDLKQHVHAVAVLVDHALNARHLAGDSLKTRVHLPPDVRLHRAPPKDDPEGSLYP